MSSAAKRSYSRYATCMSWSPYYLGSPLEARAIFGRRDADPSCERAAHRLRRPEPGAARDQVDRLGAALEPVARRLDAERLDVHRRGQAGLAPERTREVAGAHRDPLGQHLDAQVAVEVVGDPSLQLAQRG